MPLLVPLAGTIGKQEARRRLGIRENGRLALFAGHARRYKGIDVLLAAWDKAQLPNMAGLVIAGESYLGGDRLQVAVARVARARLHVVPLRRGRVHALRRRLDLCRRRSASPPAEEAGPQVRQRDRVGREQEDYSRGRAGRSSSFARIHAVLNARRAVLVTFFRSTLSTVSRQVW